MIELLKFILKNKDQFSNEKELLDKNNLIFIKGLINCIWPINFELTNEQKKLAINYFIQTNQVINIKTPNFIKNNKKCILSSIKKDIYSIKYASIDKTEDITIFKYLLFNSNQLLNTELKSVPLSYLKDKDILSHYLKYFKMYNVNDADTFSETRINQLFQDALNSSPSIKDFNKYFEIICEYKWNSYRQGNSYRYENIFAKICSYLQNSKSLELIEDDLDFLPSIRDTLKTKYNDLYEAMIKYHKIYHSKDNKKLEKIEEPRNKISALSALYIAKSKEKYKQNILEGYQGIIRKYYQLKKDHPKVLKNTIEIKQREKFKNLFYNYANSKECQQFVNNIKQKYQNQISKNLIKRMITEFIYNNKKDITEFMNIPTEYHAYQIYEKVSKIINRLNSGYLKITDYEVSKYKEFITYDETIRKYKYDGILPNEEKINEIKMFQKYQIVYKNIIKDIMKTIKKIEISEEIDEKTYRYISYQLPFTDEYFEFNQNLICNDLKFINLLNCYYYKKYNINSFKDEESYNFIHKLLVDNGIFMISLVLYGDYANEYHFKHQADIIEPLKIILIINNIKEIVSLSNMLKIDINNLTNLLNVYEINESANKEQISILGPDITSSLCTSDDYIYDYNINEIIQMSCDLICAMTKRTKSTIPYIKGENLNYKYSLYDSQDPTILLAGINTDSCFKIGGTDNDFLHYCTLNKNGLVIKITDHFDNFIARASGFRHGNIIFLNQLRTIYDKGGNFYYGEYEYETKTIIETLKQACNDIILTSSNNKQELDKIEHIFITKSYCLNKYEPTVSLSIDEELGKETIMDTKSDDWKNYLENTLNIEGTIEDDYFETDFPNYPLICLATTIKERNLETSDIKLKDVDAVYERPRNKIIVTSDITKEIYQKINKIIAIKSYYEETEFNRINIPINSLIFIGDNWFVVTNQEKIIASCYLEYDEKAKLEFDATLEIIRSKYFQNNLKQPIDYRQYISTHIKKRQ